MYKNVTINIAIDVVNLKDLDTLEKGIAEILEQYPDKRVTMILQDEPLVKFR